MHPPQAPPRPLAVTFFLGNRTSCSSSPRYPNRAADCVLVGAALRESAWLCEWGRKGRKSIGLIREVAGSGGVGDIFLI
ncbi:UNVERIFIED_CONTAM: hypothetical protein K2H54_062533 [Gekko kuhli]